MAVCDPVGGMHSLFSGALAEHVFAPRPPAVFDEQWAAEVTRLVERHAHELAAIIVEPVVQGAGGMWFYAPECVRCCASCATPTASCSILDEIATGFGRTGALFAASTRT
jgi:adenosylmethionine-8-amino-7-oxononanoate aminotransferase